MTTEFWETLFKTEGNSWGFEPADSAIETSDIFQKNGVHRVLIPVIGYGRNAKPFLDRGMEVTGIEVSATAVKMVSNLFPNVKAFHGSVLEMPYDHKMYDGIFCYALIHLFNFHERRKIISNCFQQLKPHGIMVFCAISDEVELYKSGIRIGEDRYLLPNGLKVFFLNNQTIEKEFSKFGLTGYKDIDEPIKFKTGFQPMKFKMITCKKQTKQ